jgi:hypothetical protein
LFAGAEIVAVGGAWTVWINARDVLCAFAESPA